MAKKVEDDSKVMDVSKPGKGKIVGTSRPVVAPVVSTEKPAAKTDGPPAPSTTKKVILPISDDVKPEDEPLKSSEPIPISVNTIKKTEPEEKPAESAPAEAEVSPEAPAEPAPTEEEKPADAEQPEKPSSTEPAQDESSDSASVDALVATAESKKENAKKAEEQAKADAELENLIASKKYVVPVGKGSTKSKAKFVVIFVVVLLIALAAGGYYFMFMRDEYKVVSSTSTSQSSSKASEEKSQAEKKAAAEVKANDEERKQEIKNLQQRIETYYNDNDEYPATLEDFDPPATSDELTGPNSDPYIYTPSSTNQSYVLSASLENKKDIDADSEGNYTVNSVNIE